MQGQFFWYDIMDHRYPGAAAKFYASVVGWGARTRMPAVRSTASSPSMDRVCGFDAYSG